MNNPNHQPTAPTALDNESPLIFTELQSSSIDSTPMPILPGQILTQADRENILIEAMDELVRDFLRRSNQRASFHTAFRWTNDGERKLHYSVVVVINEAPHVV
ncbi:unnamed protein product [Rotaria sordida]|uniref:Uncharacterized protein n=1 Tax=Rotaria sordida TaxID=392033 RepID=A0A819PUZ3_9BILA|nr:unnamed protein product [Rotaria sordida]CAF1430427.1 unnamed protein product [Rotaria sordida]CAF4019085.1 unnamed protein product [Rotaria sordida]CAF4208286.1 unnamed protein product [Rotaria sordida]